MSALKYALIFLAGAGVGAGVSAFFFKKKYVEVLKKSDEELKKMDEYYQNELDKAYKTTSDDTENDISSEAEEKLHELEKGIGEFFKAQTEYYEACGAIKKEQKKPEKRQGSFATDYTSYYHTEDPAESEHPREEEPVKHEPQPPKLIRAAMFGQDGYSTRVLYYYTEDDTLIPEGGTYDDIVDTDEVADSIGNALIKYGFADVNNLEREIFVRNFDRKCDYHIIKVVGSLSEDYGG